jgi:hypothetical protein
LEAYLPENKVFLYKRPTMDEWKDRSLPPPKECIRHHVLDCSDVKDVHGIRDEIPTHGGYHYCSTPIERYYLLDQVRRHRKGAEFCPHVSLNDGLRAVEIGIQATSALNDDMND